MESAMNHCEQTQTQLLAYLYDLLEPQESQAVQSHLSACTDCQTALERARNQRKILSAAAKTQFPNVQFEPPDDQTIAITARRRNRSMKRWAIAAGILLVVGLSVPATWWVVRDRQLAAEAKLLADRYTLLRGETDKFVAEQQAGIAAAIREQKEAKQEMGRLREDHQSKLAQLQKQMAGQQLKVVLTGPERVLPGAPAQFQVQTRNQVDRPVAVDVTARVLDEVTKEVVFEQAKIASGGDVRVTLPPDLPIKPDRKVALEVAALRDGNVETQARAELSLVAPVHLTHLYTDKPMYRPSETVHFRSLTLERFSLKPADENFRLIYTINNPNGEEVFHLEGLPQLTAEGTNTPLLGPDKKPLTGIGAGEFKIDPAARGGEYTLTVREQNSRFPPQERKFIVNQYENPRLNKDLDFTRKSYGPGRRSHRRVQGFSRRGGQSRRPSAGLRHDLHRRQIVRGRR
jgi:anti-sigma factor RsiW